MADADAILMVVQKIYDTALDSDAWQPTLAAAGGLIGAAHGVLLAHDVGSGMPELAVTFGMPDSGARMFGSIAVSGQAHRMLGLYPVGVAMRSSAVMPERELVRSEFYLQVSRHIDVLYSAAVAVSTYTPLRHESVSLGRLTGKDDYADEDIAALQAITPHLTKALALRRRLGSLNRSTACVYSVLDRLTIGIILLDVAGRPCFVNGRASEIIALRDGLQVGPRGVSAALPAETRALERAIGTMASLSTGSLSSGAAVRAARAVASTSLAVSRPSQRPPFRIAVTPMQPADTDRGRTDPAVALYLVQPDRPPELDTRSLAETYGLTPREAQVASLLALGADIPQVAARIGVSPESVRIYLKRALDKTDTHRQAGLVGLVLSGFTKPTAAWS